MHKLYACCTYCNDKRVVSSVCLLLNKSVYIYSILLPLVILAVSYILSYVAESMPCAARVTVCYPTSILRSNNHLIATSLASY